MVAGVLLQAFARRGFEMFAGPQVLGGLREFSVWPLRLVFLVPLWGSSQSTICLFGSVMF